MKLAFVFFIAILAFAQVGVVRAQSDQYECPMHPGIYYTKPGKCPKCGMTLVKKGGKPETAKPEKATAASADAFSSKKIPDAEVSDQNGNALNFYTDLVKGKIVSINYVFTTCTTICPPLTSTFRRVKEDAKAKGLEVQ